MHDRLLSGMGFFLRDFDYKAHNEEVKEVWAAFRERKPLRVPVGLGINPRIWLLNPELNTKGITFREYFEDPNVMAQVQMRSQHYIRHNIPQDAEMGLPEKGWDLYVDLQNVYEAAWFGAEVEYREWQAPDTRPILTNDRKRMLFDYGIPDPLTGGIMARAWMFYEHMKAHLADYEYEGIPAASVSPPALGTDGPMTVAASLRGATELCIDIYEDPDYVHELLGFITEAVIMRIKAVRRVLGHEMKPKNWGFADDSIELLSLETYREFVLPHHKRLVAELAGEGPHGIHLCGDVDRLMPTLREELNLDNWDAGFPVDYGRMRRELGRDFLIQTGPTVSLLLNGTPEQVDAECRRILGSGIMDGGRFVLKEANNLSPCTPIENLMAMYQAAKKYGKYN